MNETVVEYLRKYKEQYTKEELKTQLEKSGFAEAEIKQGIAAVYATEEAQKEITPNNLQKRGKFAMSWSLLKSSFRLLSKDKEILLFPIVSTITSIVVFVGLFLPLALFTGIFSAFTSEAGSRVTGYVVLFLYYLIGTFIIAFFNSALVSCVMARLRGEDPTFSSGLKVALSHKKEIFIWAVISATVGLVLRLILDILSQRLGVIGQVIANAIIGMIGFAWGVATYFVVPIIIVEKIRAKDAIRSSANLFKKTWGENLIGNLSMTIFFALALIPIFIISMSIALSLNSLTGAIVGFVIFVLAVIMMSVIASTINTIFRVVLYLYAKTGSVPEIFDADILQHAFQEKPLKKGLLK